MSKHTPGPWKIRNAREVFKGNRRVCSVNAAESLPLSEELARAKANACLIASAPDLLEALSGALDSLEYVEQVMPGKVGYGVRQERIAKARAAIAKATGND